MYLPVQVRNNSPGDARRRTTVQVVPERAVQGSPKRLVAMDLPIWQVREMTNGLTRTIRSSDSKRIMHCTSHGTLKCCGSGRWRQWSCRVNHVIFATLALRIVRVYWGTLPKSMVVCRNIGTRCCVYNRSVRMLWLAAKCDTMSATTAPFSDTPAWIGKGLA